MIDKHQTLEANQQSLALVPTVKKLCATLFKVTPINYFEYIEMDEFGNIKQVHNDTAVLTQLQQHRSLSKHMHKFLSAHQLQGNTIYAFAEDEPALAELASVYRENGAENLLVNCSRDHRDGKVIFKIAIFACPTAQKAINCFFVNNVSFLTKFVEYFSLLIMPIMNEQLPTQLDASIHKQCINQLRAITKNKAIDELKKNIHNPEAGDAVNLPLSFRQRIILALFALGFSAEQSSQYLRISRRTVERHFETLRQKFQSQSKYQLLQDLSQGDNAESQCLKLLLNSRDLNIANLLLNTQPTAEQEMVVSEAA